MTACRAVMLGMLLVTIGGCRSADRSQTNRAEKPSLQTTSVGLDLAQAEDLPANLPAAQGRARKAGVPLLIAIVDTGRGNEDRAAAIAFQQFQPDGIEANGKRLEKLLIDLRVSANRAVAADLHPNPSSPDLLCRSPAGVNLARGGFSQDDIQSVSRVGFNRFAATDAALRKLQQNAANGSPASGIALADFWHDSANMREAIPLYEAIAANEAVAISDRIRAWERAGEAHLYIGEPEKARHSAQRLIDTLGPDSPDAIAAGNLVRALQDLAAKRFDRCQREIDAAQSAAPNSVYAKRLGQLRQQLVAATRPQS